jgi:peptidyl-prolyl cis-trans isomerase C
MKTAKARHILVKKEKKAKELLRQLESGSDFVELAKEHSTCPSGKKGGDLGTFSKGDMVPEFDEVIFKASPNKVHGPVRTGFGFHLIEILERS